MDSNLTPEEWRPIKGYEGMYEVSDHGRVRSLERYARAAYNSQRIVRACVLQGSEHRLSNGRRSGYRIVTLCNDPKQTIFFVHRLVAEAFLGSPPAGTLVCHRDDVGSNNHVSNLYWGTQVENIQDCIRNGGNHYLIRTHCKRGHEYTPENTRIDAKGARECRICRAARIERQKVGQAARRARAKQARMSAA